MLNHPASPWGILRSNRLLRTGLCFLLSLGYAICAPLLFSSASLAQKVDTSRLKGGVFESGGVSPAETPTLTPVVICCILFLIGIVIFLLQPLYLKKKSQPRSQATFKSNSKQASRSNVTSSNHGVSPVSPEAILPLFDRLVITPRSIVASTCRSAHSAPEIRCVPRTVTQLTQLIEGSVAEVIVLTRREMTLDASEVVLGIQRLHQNHLDVVTPGSGSFVDRTDDSESLQAALYHFLYDALEIRQIDGSQLPSEKDEVLCPLDDDRASHRTCYIVSRNVLLSMLRLSQWSVADRLGAVGAFC
jgi:hypothetical protein